MLSRDNALEMKPTQFTLLGLFKISSDFSESFSLSSPVLFSFVKFLESSRLYIAASRATRRLEHSDATKRNNSI